LLDLLVDEIVAEAGAGDHAPVAVAADRLGLRDLFATLTSEAAREGIAKECIGALGFASAIDSHPASRVGDIAN